MESPGMPPLQFDGRESDEAFLRRMDAHLASISWHPEITGWIHAPDAECDAHRIRARGDRRLIPDILRLLEHRDLGSDRAALVLMLGDFEMREVIPALRRACTNDPSIRRYCIDAMRRIAPLDQAVFVESHLADKDPAVFIAAAHLLGTVDHVGGMQAVPRLRVLAQETCWRAAAMHALADLEAPHGGRPVLSASAEAWLRMVEFEDDDLVDEARDQLRSRFRTEPRCVIELLRECLGEEHSLFQDLGALLR